MIGESFVERFASLRAARCGCSLWSDLLRMIGCMAFTFIRLADCASQLAGDAVFNLLSDGDMGHLRGGKAYRARDRLLVFVKTC
jgi:hypothetical protein